MDAAGASCQVCGVGAIFGGVGVGKFAFVTACHFHNMAFCCIVLIDFSFCSCDIGDASEPETAGLGDDKEHQLVEL